MARTNMKRQYASLPKGGGNPRSSFQIGGRRLTSFRGGYLVPFYWNWVFPGDVVRGRFSAFMRAIAPLEYPLWDNIVVNIHSFFVPLRILWDNARKFYGEQVNPGDSIDYTIPTLSGSANNINSATTLSGYEALAKYLELPAVTSLDGADASAIPFRAYTKIYNHEFRDQNMQNSYTENTGDGPDDLTDYTLYSRGKRHDYFTSLLSAPQKGDAVPVNMDVRTAAGGGSVVGIYSESYGDHRRMSADVPEVQVDISTTSAETNKMHTELLITDLRQAAAIQHFLERDNRYGTRFDEIIYAHYGVEFNMPAYRPLYLGGGSGNVVAHTISQTSGSSDGGATDDRKLGDLAAIATGSIEGADFTYAVQEPGILMSIISTWADLTYFQGIPYKHSLRTRYDMMFAEFAGIGDRAVKTSEIYYQNNATDDVILGYTPRYEEFRCDTNRLNLMFDPNITGGGFEIMHLAEEFGSAPVLGNAYIQASASPFERMLQVTSDHHFLCDIASDIRVARQLTTAGNPGMGRL